MSKVYSTVSLVLKGLDWFLSCTSLPKAGEFGGITESCVHLQLHHWQRISLSNPPSLFSREETSLNNHALCLIALATPVRQTKWLPRQWGDALLTAFLQEWSLSLSPSFPLSLLCRSHGLISPSLSQNSRMPLMGPKPLFRPACVQLQLIYRNSTVDIMALLCLVSKTGFLKKAEMWLTLYFLIPMSLWGWRIAGVHKSKLVYYLFTPGDYEEFLRRRVGFTETG